jgi:hypothetical protein
LKCINRTLTCLGTFCAFFSTSSTEFINMTRVNIYPHPSSSIFLTMLTTFIKQSFINTNLNKSVRMVWMSLWIRVEKKK